MVRIGQWKWSLLILLIFVALFSYTIFHPRKARLSSVENDNTLLQSAVGHYRPDFVLPDMTGKPHTVKEWEHDVLIVNFWATWCKPCRREIPMFTRLQATKRQFGLQFIGIAIDEKAAVDNFISDLEIPINYPILVGEDDAITIAKQYGDEFGILPYSVIIDRSGRIIYIQYGEFSRSEIEQQINPLL
jgi:peroxiredoxin